MVWQFLMQNTNPWGHSNKDLLSMYRGASADNECPLVVESGTPSCGGSRMGCWVCTMVAEDKSLAAMIHNDEEKSWMLPLLEFRNYIAAFGMKSDYTQNEIDRNRRDFRRMTGKLTWHKDRLVHGPYTKEVREDFFKKTSFSAKSDSRQRTRRCTRHGIDNSGRVAIYPQNMVR